MTDFKNTREALKAYDERAYIRTARWGAIKCNADVEHAQQADIDEANKVREAFYEDTEAFNSRDNCMRVGIDYLRTIAHKPG